MKKKLNSLLLLFLMIVAIVGILGKDVNAATNIKLNSENVELAIGSATQLNLEGAKGTVKWTTSDKTIATVTSKGKVKAIKKGNATITATYKKVKYSCNVKVITNFDNMFNKIRDEGIKNANGYKSILKEFDDRMYSLTYIKDKKEFEFKYMYDYSDATYVVTITIPRNGAKIVPVDIMYINNKKGSYFYGKASIRRSLYSKTYNVPLEVTKASGKYYSAYVKKTNIAVRKAFAAWNSIVKIKKLGFKNY